MKDPKRYIGRRFDHLEVIDSWYTKKSVVVTKCVCDCGEVVERWKSSLEKDTTNPKCCNSVSCSYRVKTKAGRKHKEKPVHKPDYENFNQLLTMRWV